MELALSLSLARLGIGSTVLTPAQQVAALFANGEQGAWYDPSDRSTLFQDAAGTLPVTEVEQPVGLMLDRRKGLALGSELITNAADREFSSDTGYWLLGAQGSISGGTFNVTAGSGTQISKTIAGMGLTQGKWYKVTYTITSLTSGSFRWQFSSAVTTRTAAGTYTEYWLPDGTTLQGFCGTNTTLSLDNISVKLIDGNHAYQTLATARPHLRSRYNLLTYSEQFDNAAWLRSRISPFGSGSIANAVIAPDQTTTADKLAATTENGYHYVRSTSLTVGASSYSFSVYAKSAGWNYLFIQIASDANFTNYYEGAFNLLSGQPENTNRSVNYTGSQSIEDVGDGWYRCKITVNSTIANSNHIVQIQFDNNNDPNNTAAGNDSDGVYLWGAQLNLGSTAMSYQRIAATPTLSQPPTYATTSTMGGEVFRPYLWWDGIDDILQTASIDFSAGDAMTVCAGLRKIHNANYNIFTELSASATSNAGTFALFAPLTAGADTVSYRAGGSTRVTISGTGNNLVRYVVTAQSDISDDSIRLRANGSSIATGTSDQGTGNFGNYPLYVGSRSSEGRFSGEMYGMVIRGAATSDTDRGNVESYMATKTGVTL